MMPDLVGQLHPLLEALAQAWQAAGAQALAACHTGRVMFARGDAPAAPPDLVATGRTCELRLWGPHDPASHARLLADLQALEQARQLNSELDEMTSALIEVQDLQLALYALTESTRRRLSLDEALPLLVRETARLAQADSAAALVVLPDTPVSAQAPVALLDAASLQELFEFARLAGSTVIAATADRLAGLPMHIHNVLVEPITIRDQITAALIVINKPDGFSAPDRKLIHVLAQQAGAQIENALLHQELLAQARLQTEMDLARRVQTQLLPHTAAQVIGLDTAAQAIPALEVGGDFFDVVTPPQQPPTFVVGDIAGKGLASALLMAMAHTVIRSAAKRNASPAAILQRAGSDLYEDLSEISSFATTCVVQFHADRHELVMANAGHSPVIYCPRGGRARLLEADALPLGILPDCAAADQVLPFLPGDVLAILTDGFNETFDAREELFGHDRLLRLIENHADRPAAAIASALLEAVEAFGAGHRQDDDRTYIILKGTPA